MTDATLSLYINGAVAIIVPIAVALIAKEIKKVSAKVVTVETKVDAYHKEVDGMKTELVQTTRELGEKVGAANNQAETDAKKQKDK